MRSGPRALFRNWEFTKMRYFGRFSQIGIPPNHPLSVSISPRKETEWELYVLNLGMPFPRNIILSLFSAYRSASALFTYNCFTNVPRGAAVKPGRRRLLVRCLAVVVHKPGVVAGGPAEVPRKC